MGELKPCPFCGGEGEVVATKAFEWCDNVYIVRCASDYCKVNPSVTSIEKKEAIEAWNRRVDNE